MSGLWKNLSGSTGAHYSVFAASPGSEMQALREMFPDGEADGMNFVLFSTSGVHGTYNTIEEVERTLNGDATEDDECDDVTFLVVQPRIVSVRYGNCKPESAEDIAFLKELRATSIRAIREIGAIPERDHMPRAADEERLRAIVANANLSAAEKWDAYESLARLVTAAPSLEGVRNA